MKKPFVLIYSGGGLVPQDNELPRFDTLQEAIDEGRARDYDIAYDMAIVLEMTGAGGIRVAYEFGEADNANSFEESDDEEEEE